MEQGSLIVCCGGSLRREASVISQGCVIKPRGTTSHFWGTRDFNEPPLSRSFLSHHVCNVTVKPINLFFFYLICSLLFSRPAVMLRLFPACFTHTWTVTHIQPSHSHHFVFSLFFILKHGTFFQFIHSPQWENYGLVTMAVCPQLLLHGAWRLHVVAVFCMLHIFQT